MNGILAGKKVAVLMGGPGSERDVSLRSGAAVAEAASQCGAKAVTVDVHGAGFSLPAGTDLAFNMVHGTFGEDGTIQDLLDRMGVPYTGEGAVGSRLAFDKTASKRKFDAAGVPTAAWTVLEAGQEIPWEPPFVVKAPKQGSSVGVHIVTAADQVAGALSDCLRYDTSLLVERFFDGRELTVGVLGSDALPVVEIVPGAGFYDYKNKYTPGATQYFVPAEIGQEATRAVRQAALDAHRALGLEVYSRVDILLAPDGSLNVMEINTIPGMTETSLLPKAAAVAGIPFPGLCERIAALSLKRFP
jgi:D-alanine-D-alanine ligase